MEIDTGREARRRKEERAKQEIGVNVCGHVHAYDSGESLYHAKGEMLETPPSQVHFQPKHTRTANICYIVAALLHHAL